MWRPARRPADPPAWPDRSRCARGLLGPPRGRDARVDCNEFCCKHFAARAAPGACAGPFRPQKRSVSAIAKAEPKAAADAVGGSDVIEELRRRYDRLTHSQKRIAEYIIAHSH